MIPLYKMKILLSGLCLLLLLSPPAFAQQDLANSINKRIEPPLEQHSISARLAELEKELAEAAAQAEYWRNARFYNDPKRERMRREKLVFWAQKTVEIRNEMTRLKQDRSYFKHKNYGSERYYYKRD